MSDRIDAGVFAMAAAAAGGEINLVGANLDHLGVVRWKLEQMGVEFSSNGAVLQVRREKPLRPINVITSPFPGFATDLQSPIMALATMADGASYIRETIFDGRYTLVPELNKMGAKVEIDNNVAIVHGPTALPRLRRRGARPARRRGADPGRAWPPRARPWSRPATSSTAGTRRSPSGCARSAPTSPPRSTRSASR